MSVLVAAWHAIRRNAETSQQEKTKQSARKFGENLPANLRKLQDRLRLGYRFAEAYGATPQKGAGKIGRRPIVVAPLEDRIVQRAILDVLQSATEISDVQRVLQTPTSIGGIRGRGVNHAIALFDERVKAGDRFVAGSDISGFFTKIPRLIVIEFLRTASVELEFVRLVEEALTVELSNADKLSEADRKLFPTGEDGVAQGCPLSAVAGNIVLEAFDRQMNGRGITCIRYIDDFIVIGKTPTAVQKAMDAAKVILAELKMDIYDPSKSPSKAFIGAVGEPHTFLGYKLLPGVYPPSDAACNNLMAHIQSLIANGQAAISKGVAGRPWSSKDRCYAQTNVVIDHTVRGWRASFRASNCPEIFDIIDKQIDRRLNDFCSFYLSKIAKRTAAQRRRALGVQLLSD
ncbi:reverse transcriptase domain-containing protein [Mesorhizobium sp. ORM16]|uniref:reverse transcriptase domain-containing protein n=1 Tax=Mesorhizobium sp. ORM16 TaxID=3376989 RepID=UPI003857670D